MADMDTIGAYGELTVCALCWSDPECGHPESGSADISEGTFFFMRMDSTRRPQPFNLADHPDQQYEGIDPLARYKINRDKAAEVFGRHRCN